MWNGAKRCEIVVVCFSCLTCQNMAKGEPWETGTDLLCTSQQPWDLATESKSSLRTWPMQGCLKARSWMALGARRQELRRLDRTHLEIHMQTLSVWRLNGGHTPSLSPSSSRDCPKWNLSRLPDFTLTESCGKQSFCWELQTWTSSLHEPRLQRCIWVVLFKT